ncbi:MAG: hypothetical protein WBN23_16015 [Woeseia sp.]
MVGDSGKVLLVNNPPYDAFAKDALSARLADGRLANVDYLLVPNDSMGLGNNRLDGALIIMSCHDLFYADPENGWPDVGHDQFIDQIVTALKPGGRFLITDHAAQDGSGSSADAAPYRREVRDSRTGITRTGVCGVHSGPAQSR